MVRFAFFFFFLNFDLNWPFRPIRPELVRINPIQHIWPKSEPRWLESLKKKKSWTQHRPTSSGVPHMSPCQATLDASAAWVFPRPCIPVLHMHSSLARSRLEQCVLGNIIFFIIIIIIILTCLCTLLLYNPTWIFLVFDNCGLY